MPQTEPGGSSLPGTHPASWHPELEGRRPSAWLHPTWVAVGQKQARPPPSLLREGEGWLLSWEPPHSPWPVPFSVASLLLASLSHNSLHFFQGRGGGCHGGREEAPPPSNWCRDCTNHPSFAGVNKHGLCTPTRPCGGQGVTPVQLPGLLSRKHVLLKGFASGMGCALS